jgi:hypothetical protein
MSYLPELRMVSLRISQQESQTISEQKAGPQKVGFFDFPAPNPYAFI